MRTTSIGIALLLSACGGGSGSDAGPSTAMDAPAFDAPALDAPELDAPTIDAPALDAPELDAPAFDAPVADTPPDALADAPMGNGCEAAGGSCDPVVPGVCMDGIIGDADRYSCGPGVGVLCCLPIDTPPICDRVGTVEEGWYAPDGTRICAAVCDGTTATCEAIGTRSEGWYASTIAAGCSSTVDRLIEWTDCSP